MPELVQPEHRFSPPLGPPLPPPAHLKDSSSKQCPNAAADGPSWVTKAPTQQSSNAEAATHTGRRSSTLHPGRCSVIDLINPAEQHSVARVFTFWEAAAGPEHPS